MKNIVKAFLGVVGGVFIFGLYVLLKGTDKVLKQEIKDDWDAVFVGGLDYRSGDLSLSDQLQLLKNGFGKEKRVKAYRYNEDTSVILNFLKEYPKTPVFLFSASCDKSSDLADSLYVDPKLLFIIEPYATSSNVRKIVSSAVLEGGVPRNNVFFGNGQSRGEGIVVGATYTGGADHWGALTFVGRNKRFI